MARSGLGYWLSALALLCTFLLARVVAADGLPAYWDDRGWHLLGERSQDAVIVLRNGKETLLLQIALSHGADEERARKVVWFTPIPAAPSDVHLAVLRGFPEFSGKQPVRAIAATMKGVAGLMAATQLWTWPALAGTLVLGADRSNGEAVLHQSLSRDGVEVELLSATSIDGLRSYLLARDVVLPDAAVTALSTYFGQSRCFVFARVADWAAYRQATGENSDPQVSSLGIEVEFPSDQGFFPLLVSAGLPGESVVVRVTSVGFAHAVERVPPELTTEHYIGTYRAPEAVLQTLQLPPSGPPVPYTRFRIVGPPRQLQADLHFKPGAPPATEVAAKWLAYRHHRILEFGFALGLFAALSMVAAWAARGLWPPQARPSVYGSFALGLTNLLTLVGMLVACRIYAVRRGVPRRRGLAFAALTSGLFSAELVLFIVLVTLLEHALRP